MCLLGDRDLRGLPRVSAVCLGPLCGFLSKEPGNAAVWSRAHARQEVALGVCSSHTRIPARSLLTPSSLSPLRKEGAGVQNGVGCHRRNLKIPFSPQVFAEQFL